MQCGLPWAGATFVRGYGRRSTRVRRRSFAATDAGGRSLEVHLRVHELLAIGIADRLRRRSACPLHTPNVAMSPYTVVATNRHLLTGARRTPLTAGCMLLAAHMLGACGAETGEEGASDVGLADATADVADVDAATDTPDTAAEDVAADLSDDDAGDTAAEDSSADADVDAGNPCGNGTLDPGERCDDGNLVAGDGCDESCAREAFCGDGELDEGERCDDGNNQSGDGCRSDCNSDETCGNDIIDFAGGEVCDDATACVDCAAVTACGDGEVGDGEACDDGNAASFDGCSAGCLAEHALVVNRLALAGNNAGCDLNGDGSPDNAFGRALGPLAGAINPLIADELSASSHRIVFVPQGLDDPTGANDDEFRIAWVTSEDADDDPDNDFDGRGVFTVNPSVVSLDGVPAVALQARVRSNMLEAGPEDIPLLDEETLSLGLRAGRIVGTTVSVDGELHDIRDGFICGGFDMPLLVEAGLLTEGRIVSQPACGGGDPAQLVDILLAGGDVGAELGGGAVLPLTFGATPPDLDLDGDGLEGFEFSSGEDCQPIIVACIDGDGSRIEGRDCLFDPAIADGYSASFTFTAIDATVLGVRR